MHIVKHFTSILLFQCNHHCFYGFWRLFWALCHATWVLLSWVTDSWAQHSSTERLKWFIYLTNWTYLLLTLETVLEAINFFCVHMLREDILKGKVPTITKRGKSSALPKRGKNSSRKNLTRPRRKNHTRPMR